MSPAVGTSACEEGGGVDRVAAVVVAFHPDAGALHRLLQALAPQVGRILLVDNTPGPAYGDVTPELPPRAERMALGTNLGLAAAQNRGIARARSLGAEHVILFDQDSEPAPGMVRALLQAEARLRSQGERIAAVGPRWQDPRDGAVGGFVQVSAAGRAHLGACPDPAQSPRAALRCDYLIASGCLISMAAIDAVGAMDEALFIDQIDIEWCLRAGRRGLSCYGVCEAHLRHRVGLASRRVWFFGWRSLPRNAPERDYYLARNLLALALWGGLPLRWRILNAKVLVNLLVAAAVAPGERGRRLQGAGLGMLHGLFHRGGPR